MLPLELSAILSTFIKIRVVIKTVILSIFVWSFYTVTVLHTVVLTSHELAHLCIMWPTCPSTGTCTQVLSHVAWTQICSIYSTEHEISTAHKN